ncbi:MAG TPA: PAS domain-containing sensor histidine kinase [Aggregatilinea sp.]|jgi:PAS domain S-box-containing protein|uniref:sensor histidine kinase n=1 Tax=Aggregatilinea sp. TaxID=2806333 RepID=UPI002BE9E109|nr:PAS domain-containing sensor histidine kinase [Aggregatilinea sp.]HML21376.1 PAS domain-containing sensor histidine kinase [Aggregatilinea sp.]
MDTPRPENHSEVETLQQQIAALEKEKQELCDALRSYQDQFTAVFEHAGDSIFVVDPVSLQILSANALAEHRFGYSRDELLSLGLDKIEVQPSDNGNGGLVWESSFSGTRVYECHYRRKDGSLVSVEVSSRFGAFGEQNVLVNFVRDNTYRKKIEAEREQLIAELDAFAHTVAHDLKNPLGMIQGYANMLSTEFEDLSLTEIMQYLEHIELGVDKMVTLIDELLLFASVRRLDTVPSNPLEMKPIVDEALARLRWMIQEYEAEIVVPDMWPMAWGYPAWIEEVWTNYLSNAMKYGGRPPRVELGSTPLPDGRIRFWVRDNGDGIAEDDLSRLFKQFSRLGDMRVTGHGLGLSIVSRIIEKLGGSVEAESTPGQGSTFSFLLPAHSRSDQSLN